MKKYTIMDLIGGIKKFITNNFSKKNTNYYANNKGKIKGKGIAGWLISTAIIVFIYFYITLPPINIFDTQFYIFALVSLGISLVAYMVFVHQIFGIGKKIIKYHTMIALMLVVMFAVFNLSSLVIFNAKRYSRLINRVDGVFATDVKPVDFDNIPVVDRSTAEKLGSRKMGEMGDLVSQYDIDDTYSQINVKGRPVRVTPLVYSDLFKWFKNKGNGIPYYISVDMATQKTALNKLDKPIWYSFSDKFSRDIKRHIRFNYPTAILGEINLELDDGGTPYWIAPVVSPTVGLFGGRDVKACIVVNAITGEHKKYPVKDVPKWVDRVYPAEMIIDQLTMNGKLQRGYFNQYFGQKGVTKPSQGYNYLSLGEDIYLYTGLTSVVSDQSNIGFVLINMRTKDTKFYPVSSAEEYSVMDSAKGAVQEKGYTATFPILININNRPTYFMSLKDKADLTKMFAFVDAQSYQNVAIGSTIPEALGNYNRINQTFVDDGSSAESSKITVKEIFPVTIEGNTNYFIKAKENNMVYVAKITVNSGLPFVKPGDVLEVTGNKVGTQFNITIIK